jgi:hypothetical protein
LRKLDPHTESNRVGMEGPAGSRWPAPDREEEAVVGEGSDTRPKAGAGGGYAWRWRHPGRRLERGGVTHSGACSVSMAGRADANLRRWGVSAAVLLRPPARGWVRGRFFFSTR